MVHLNTHKYEKSLRRLNIDMKAGNVIFHIFRAHNLFFSLFAGSLCYACPNCIWRSFKTLIELKDGKVLEKFMDWFFHYDLLCKDITN